MSEIGGDFHWTGLIPGSFLAWPEPHVFWGTGRATVVQLIQNPGTRLWIPTYFCPETVGYWKQQRIEIVLYQDHPALNQPILHTLTPARGDVVIAVNYFGTRSFEFWNSWQKSHPGIILIEDHTHDPQSDWCRYSQADFAFASLRKTMPVPDGAILWSPRNHPLPPEPTIQTWTGSALKLAGMIWKMDYLSSGEADSTLKQIFREFQIQGEKLLEEDAGHKITPWSRALLEKGYPRMWREMRERNTLQFIDRFKSQISPYSGLSLLFDCWPVGGCPFNPVLLAASSEQRDALRQHLISKGIYSPIHWSLSNTMPFESAIDISRRILTIPVDHRCTPNDLDQIIFMINDYLNTL